MAPSSQAATLAAISRALTMTKPTLSGEISNPAMRSPSRLANDRTHQSMPELQGGDKATWCRSRPVQTCRGLANHRLEHGGGEPPGIGVLARAMIAVEQDKPARQRRVARRGQRGNPASSNSARRGSPSWAMRPSANSVTRLGRAAMRPIRNWRQRAISSGFGLFCGGTQRTALEIMQSTSSSSSGAAGSCRPRANPSLSSVR